MIIFLVYYGVLSICLGLSEDGSMPPWIALSIPNLLGLGASLYFIRKMGTEEWQSIAEGVEGALDWIAKKARRLKRA